MLLMSSRPMIASLLECVTLMSWSPWVWRSVGRACFGYSGNEHCDDGPQEIPRRRLVAEVDVGAGGEEVRDREARQHVDETVGDPRRYIAHHQGRERHGRHADDAWEAG